MAITRNRRSRRGGRRRRTMRGGKWFSALKNLLTGKSDKPTSKPSVSAPASAPTPVHTSHTVPTLPTAPARQMTAGKRRKPRRKHTRKHRKTSRKQR